MPFPLQADIRAIHERAMLWLTQTEIAMNPVLQQTYWLATFALLAGYFGGWHPGLEWAMVLTAAQGVQLTLTRRGFRALDVQVRWFYVGLLLLGTMPGMRWLHPLLFAGLMARLATEYCLAARLLVLLPWNRSVPFSAALVQWVLLSAPAPGSITARLAEWGRQASRGRDGRIAGLE
jgi:hypothetical protein